jgi:hypothetical protein
MPTDPAWILDFLAAVMLLVAAYCAARVVTVRRLHRTLHYDVNTAHVAMGAAMAGMLRPALNPLPNGLWEAIFSGFAVWFAWRSVSFLAQRGLGGRADDHVHGISHYLTHLVMSCAMLYVYFTGVPAVSSPTGMAMGPAPGAADFVVLPLLFVGVLVVSAVWHLDALSRFAVVRVSADGSSEGQWLAPRLEMGCHIAMCVAMGFMLVLLL